EGADNIHRGMMSLLIGAVAVFVFALIFYRRTGLLTMLNLVLIVLLILAIMSLFLSTLTLPGIAGLVLTLGMAIDANVLINERIKEERRLGAGPRAALHAGFNKAFTAIVDGNLTTLLTGIILTKVGSGAVAGFALSLCIGILATLYVALLVYKTSMYWCFEKGVITEVKGLELFKQTNWNIVGFGRKIALINLIVMLGTFSFFLYRWDKNLGLDFLGGNQIVVQFTEPTSRESVLKAVESIKNADGLPKYSAVEAQARFALKDADEKDADENERTSSGGKSFEIRFPSKTGADVTDARSEEIKSDLRQAFNGLDGKPKLVQDGFSTSFSTVEEAELRATVSVSRPEGIEPSMLDTDNWLNYLPGFDAGDTDKLKNDWFKDIDGTVQTPSFKTATDKQTQAITFVIADVKIKGNKLDDAAQKFHGALKDKLTAIGAGVMSKDDAFPAKDDIVQARASKGQITALVRLDKPEDTAVFSAKLRELSGKLEDSLIQSGIVIVNATGAIENNAGREFEIKTPSGKITWDDNGRAQTVAALERLQPQIEDWFNEDGSGNHVSNPFPRASAIGSRVAGETQARAVIALILSLIGIIIYMGVRFKGAAWGYAGVSALIQDVLITLGALAVADEIFGDIKLDLNAVAALLTVIGYSINDTIVIFDRIREELKIDFDTGRKRPFPEVINVAVNRTFSRTVLTGASVFAVVLAMLVLGGPAIRSFSLTLFFGLLFGTYFSIVRAGPFLLFFTGKSKDVLAEFERELAAKKEAERAEAEAMAAISLEREAAENSGDEPQPQGSK
ncbi:MAG: protein translocase subunit SecF, partial [Planctomycetes bacterium]|nr:protein translocase subunit SecF [Planctomycetota bacterium]